MENTNSVEDLKGKLEIDWNNPIISEEKHTSIFYHGKTEFGKKIVVKQGRYGENEEVWKALRNEIEVLGRPEDKKVIHKFFPKYRIEKDPQGRDVLVMEDLVEIGFNENFRELVDRVSLPERRMIFVDLMEAVSGLINAAALERRFLGDILGREGKGIWFKKNSLTQHYDFLFTDFGFVDPMDMYAPNIKKDEFINLNWLLIDGAIYPSLLPSFFPSLLHIEGDKVVVDDKILNDYINGELAEILTMILRDEAEYLTNKEKGIDNWPLKLYEFFKGLKKVPMDSF